MIEIPMHLLKEPTPFFACSRSVLERQVAALGGLGVDVFYSVKTNPEHAILRELQRIGVGFSVSSPVEMLSAASVGADVSKVIYYERGLTKDRAGWLTRLGCRNFMVESMAAFENLRPLLGGESTVLVRLKAEETKSAYSGEYAPGVGLSDAESVMKECKKLGAKTGVLHHSASQVEDAAAWKRKFEVLSKLPEMDAANIGGGIPISYGGGDEGGKILGEIRKGVKSIKAKRVIAEPGRFIVGPACSLVAKAVLVDGANAVLDCSVYNAHIDTIIAGIILPSRLLAKPGEAGAARPKTAHTANAYRLLGSSLCSLDVFDHGAKLGKLSAGDFITFDNAGAYNFSSDFGSGSGINTYIVE